MNIVIAALWYHTHPEWECNNKVIVQISGVFTPSWRLKKSLLVHSIQIFLLT